MNHFPVFLNLKDKKVIIFGGGEFALQRIKKLAPFGACFTVISSEICKEIKDLQENNPNITCCEREMRDSDFDVLPCLAIVAENEEKTPHIYNTCKKHGLLVNAVDNPKYCDVIFPSVVSRNNFCIGISSGGLSPTATVEYKERIEEMLPDNIDEILEFMPIAKETVKKSGKKEEFKSNLRKVFKKCVELDRPLDKKEILELIK